MKNLKPIFFSIPILLFGLLGQSPKSLGAEEGEGDIHSWQDSIYSDAGMPWVPETEFGEPDFALPFESIVMTKGEKVDFPIRSTNGEMPICGYPIRTYNDQGEECDPYLYAESSGHSRASCYFEGGEVKYLNVYVLPGESIEPYCEFAKIEGGYSLVSASADIPSGEYYVPMYVNGEPVIEIGDGAFEGGGDFTLHCPWTLKRVGNRSFYNAKTQVNLPQYLESIGSEAFYSPDIRSLYLPESLKSIGENAFYEPSSMDNIIFDPTLLEYMYGEYVGYDRVGYLFGEFFLSESTGVLSVVKAGDLLFPTSVAGHRVTSIWLDETDFDYDPQRNIEIPEGIVSVFGFANLNIFSLSLPSTLLSIGERAFADNHIQYVFIPDNVTYIGTDAFLGNDDILIYLEADAEGEDFERYWNSCLPVVYGYVDYYGYEGSWYGIGTIGGELQASLVQAGYDWDKVVIPSSIQYVDEEGVETTVPVKTILNGAFSSSSEWPDIVIEEGVTTLMHNAINCTFQSLVLPRSLRHINMMSVNYVEDPDRPGYTPPIFIKSMTLRYESPQSDDQYFPESYALGKGYYFLAGEYDGDVHGDYSTGIGFIDDETEDSLVDSCSYLEHDGLAYVIQPSGEAALFRNDREYVDEESKLDLQAEEEAIGYPISRFLPNSLASFRFSNLGQTIRRIDDYAGLRDGNLTLTGPVEYLGTGNRLYTVNIDSDVPLTYRPSDASLIQDIHISSPELTVMDGAEGLNIYANNIVLSGVKQMFSSFKGADVVYSFELEACPGGVLSSPLLLDYCASLIIKGFDSIPDGFFSGIRDANGVSIENARVIGASTLSEYASLNLLCPNLESNSLYCGKVWELTVYDSTYLAQSGDSRITVSNLEFAESTTSIRDYAFQNVDCDYISSSYGLSFESIGERAFANSTGFDVFLAESYGDGAYEGAKIDTFDSYLTFLENAETIGERCFASTTYGDDGHEVSLDGTGHLTVLPSESFADISAMKEARLSEGLLELGDGCFSNTPLRKIYLPSTIESIGEGALDCCEAVFFYGEAVGDPEVYGNAGIKVFENASLEEYLAY